jgi:hypothetical protein
MRCNSTSYQRKRDVNCDPVSCRMFRDDRGRLEEEDLSAKTWKTLRLAPKIEEPRYDCFQ